ERVGQMGTDAGIDMLLSYGEASQAIADTADVPAYHTNDKAALTEHLRETAKAGDCVLFKGSHGMHLEEVIEAIYGAV
ncbi:MAG: UDP-N-acetylmuramoyl-tripeptide--D-alanyl-D-alanine ligase, partial [Oscillospiraceae bacterium]|nr:UDP-N-acetylmuramoyl-tripeptide--D-alanyl-D-alanine ligase [Oscillospiraceae bacterium]